MKRLARRLSLVAAFAAITWYGGTTAIFAAEEDRGNTGERLERLEQRVNEMAQRQEQLLRRLGAQQERQGPATMPGPEGPRPRGALPGLGGLVRPEPALVPLAPAASPTPVAEHAWHKIADLIKFCCLVGFIFNILIAMWIFTDIRKRGEGSGIFVALALLAGVPAAIIYAIVRIGDRKG